MKRAMLMKTSLTVVELHPRWHAVSILVVHLRAITARIRRAVLWGHPCVLYWGSTTDHTCDQRAAHTHTSKDTGWIDEANAMNPSNPLDECISRGAGGRCVSHEDEVGASATHEEVSVASLGKDYPLCT